MKMGWIAAQARVVTWCKSPPEFDKDPWFRAGLPSRRCSQRARELDIPMDFYTVKKHAYAQGVTGGNRMNLNTAGNERMNEAS